jgi:hypothetical protein
MRSLILGAVALCATSAAPAGAAPDGELVAPVRTFIDSFNRGDGAAAAATHASDVTIIDEVAPYLWRGPQAFQTWSAALDEDAKARGITEQKVTIGAATREETSGDRAYVVVPAVYSYQERGVAMREPAQFVFVLGRGAGGWRIQGWAWTGPKPERVEGAAAR